LRADLVVIDGAEKGIKELQLGVYKSVTDYQFKTDSMSVFIEDLKWDNVVFKPEKIKFQSEYFTGWFDKWFEPEDKRYDKTKLFGGIVHSLIVDEKGVVVDFGSAPNTGVLGCD
jgi:hypothetical protein